MWSTFVSLKWQLIYQHFYGCSIKSPKKLEHGTKIDKNVHVSVKQHYVFGNFLINKKIKIKLTKKKKRSCK